MAQIRSVITQRAAYRRKTWERKKKVAQIPELSGQRWYSILQSVNGRRMGNMQGVFM